jgi:hypothetical protein
MVLVFLIQKEIEFGGLSMKLFILCVISMDCMVTRPRPNHTREEENGGEGEREVVILL